MERQGTIRFRRATNADRRLAQDLVDAALREYGLGVLLDSSDVDLTDLERHYDARGGAFEILESGGAPVGVLGWRVAVTAAERICELKKLYLAREARGRGWGRLSLERVRSQALDAGCAAVTLETAAVLVEANRLYTRFGFTPVQGAAAGAFADLSEQCDRAYRLSLAPSGVAPDEKAAQVAADLTRAG